MHIDPIYGSRSPIVRVYLLSAIFSCSFGQGYNVVCLYLEILLAPINSVLVEMLWIKFTKPLKVAILDRKISKFDQQNDWTWAKHLLKLGRVLRLMEGKFNQFFFKFPISSKNHKIWLSFVGFVWYLEYFVVWNLVTSKCSSCKICLKIAKIWTVALAG